MLQAPAYASDITYLTTASPGHDKLTTGQRLLFTQPENLRGPGSLIVAYATIDNNCDFILFAARHETDFQQAWHSQTQGEGKACFLQLNDDGSLAVHTETGGVFPINLPVGRIGPKTFAISGRGFAIKRTTPDAWASSQDGPSLWEVDSEGPLPTLIFYGGSPDASNRLDTEYGPVESSLKMGEFLPSADGSAFAILQPSDCNFVVYDSKIGIQTNAVWTSQTQHLASNAVSQ